MAHIPLDKRTQAPQSGFLDSAVGRALLDLAVFPFLLLPFILLALVFAVVFR
jgi:hypothetical protein